MKHTSTILIVDDQLSAREVLRGLLVEQGYNLALASNGKEALAKAAELTPDVILLDVMMPGMDGFEVCKRLRADPILAEVPVIMVTALDDQDSFLQGLEAGADDFISKPFNHTELRARVRTITQLNRYRRLHTERTKFEWAVEKAGDGYLVVDDSDTILYANSQARLYLGLPTDKDEPTTPAGFLELAGKQYHCEPEPAWATWPEFPSSSAQSPRYLVRPESSTAAAFWLQVDTLELPDRSIRGWVVHLQDVTAQISLGYDVWGVQAMISHKLRTPLFSIVMGLTILQEKGITKFLDAEMAEMFDMVCQSVQHLEQDIEDIMQYIDMPTLTKPGTGFEFSQLESIVTRINADLDLNTVTVSNQTGLSIAQISLSKQAVELVLREILENTKKFHPQQSPTVEILVSLKNNGQVSLKISDDGTTLSPEQLAQIWTPYYQGEKYFTGEIVGMGLGLTKVALLVWSVGGTCRINNREAGPGVILELILPLSKRNGELNE